MKECPRCRSRKNLSSCLAMKFILLKELPLKRKTYRRQKISTMKFTKKEPQRVGQEGQICGIVQTNNSLSRKLTKGRIITTAEVLPKEEGVQALHQAPHPGGSVPGRQTSRTFGLEDQRVQFQESHRPRGNRDSSLKGCTQKLTCFRTQGRRNNLG